MLRFLRKYSASTGIKILYGFLAACFVLWGVGTVGGERQDVVARVHDRPITRRELDLATATLERRYQELLKDRFTTEMARSLDLRGRALDQLIEDTLIRHEAERLGIDVTDAELVEAITVMPELQDEGRFNRERLETFLHYQRDRGEFEAGVRQGLLRERLEALVVDGLQVTEGEAEERYRLDNTKWNLAFVRIPPAGAAEGEPPTDEELERQRTADADRYRVPTQVRVRYARYRAADFLDGIEVPESAVTEYYDRHKDERFTDEEQVRARHVLVKVAPAADEAARAAARERAEKILADARAGKDFAALATKHSDDPGSAAQGGDLGFFPRGRMVPEFDEAAFALEPGTLSDVVESPFGFHVIKVEERRPAGTRPLEAVHDVIVASLREERARERAYAQAEADRHRVVGGQSLEAAVGDRPLEETPPFPADAAVPGIGRVEAFSAAAFALGEGEVSDLVEADDSLYLLTPLERIESHIPPLDQLRARLEVDVQRGRGEAQAKSRAEALLARAREIGLEKAAAEAGLAVEETGPFGRREPIPKVAGAVALREDMLALRPESPLAPKVYTTSGDAVVVALRELIPADMSGFAAAKDALVDSILQQKRYAIVDAYMDFLKARAQEEGALEVRGGALGRG